MHQRSSWHDLRWFHSVVPPPIHQYRLAQEIRSKLIKINSRRIRVAIHHSRPAPLDVPQRVPAASLSATSSQTGRPLPALRLAPSRPARSLPGFKTHLRPELRTTAGRRRQRRGFHCRPHRRKTITMVSASLHNSLVRNGSFWSDRYGRGTRRMSALPPIATESMPRTN
jgi:hypothetical protein